MNNNDWTDLGNDIRDMVDRAVNSHDFRQLNENICRTVTDGLDNISSNIRKSFGYDDQPGPGVEWMDGYGPNAKNGNGRGANGQAAGQGPAGQGTNYGSQTFTGQGPGGRAYGAQGYGQNRSGTQKSGSYTAPNTGVPYGNSRSASSYGNRQYTGNAGGGYPNGQACNYAGGQQSPSQYGRTYSGNMNRFPENVQQAVQRAGSNLMQHPLFARTFGTQAGGTALSAVGYTIAGVSAISLLCLLLVGFVEGWPYGMSIAAGVLGIVFAGASAMAWQGTKMLGRVRRFRKYVNGLGGRTYCSIKELAQHVGKNEKFVRKDLRKLIGTGWFKQGHMDRLETCLIVSNETYQQYEESQKQLEMRQKQEQEEGRIRQKENEGLDEEVKEMIRTGNEYIERIKKSNDAIPGEEISEKISHMQMIVEKIFQRVKEHPEYADDLRKFMDYYLPTTVKLLDAYEELDRQPVQGENILNGKQEIEKTLDTLNLAFEKLLDSLFEETAWDVSTDISVLKTMLAQEGLTESDLKKGK